MNCNSCIFAVDESNFNCGIFNEENLVYYTKLDYDNEKLKFINDNKIIKFDNKDKQNLKEIYEYLYDKIESNLKLTNEEYIELNEIFKNII